MLTATENAPPAFAVADPISVPPAFSVTLLPAVKPAPEIVAVVPATSATTTPPAEEELAPAGPGIPGAPG